MTDKLSPQYEWVIECMGLSDKDLEDELTRPVDNFQRIVEREALRRILKKLRRTVSSNDKRHK